MKYLITNLFFINFQANGILRMRKQAHGHHAKEEKLVVFALLYPCYPSKYLGLLY